MGRCLGRSAGSSLFHGGFVGIPTDFIFGSKYLWGWLWKQFIKSGKISQLKREFSSIGRKIFSLKCVILTDRILTGSSRRVE
ncbi:hypothetical protein BUQ74_04715 [Leptospira weilii serovar Heyan]|nr:hypothetical protein BUQ74_04715 [Leptospira weilii serovar Heyan]